MNAWPDPSRNSEITGHQRAALSLATRKNVGILGGSPGVGKTYSSASMIKAVAEQVGVDRIAVACPTGKAAVRITQAMGEHGVPIEATTIHRLLGTTRNGHDGQGWGFIHNEDFPLPVDYLFIDESSMIDTNLAYSLSSACRTGTRVLWIGDFNQLPPVGHGAPLRDFIAAGVPYGELTEIKRNAGRGVQVCREIKEGKPYHPSPNIDLSVGENVRHIETNRPASSIAALSRLIETSSQVGFNPAWDIQVLCTVNEKSELCRKALNEHLQGMLNPHGHRVKGNPFRLGDKVICTSNTMLPLLGSDGEPLQDFDDSESVGGSGGGGKDVKEFVANGEIGKVVVVEPKYMHVEFFAPARTVRVPLGNAKKSDDTGRNDDNVAGAAGDFTLAYAITVHKSQGSQWPVTITMIDDYPGAARVACRELYYTGLSRFETMSVTIGRAATLNKHCRRVSLRERKTFLREELAFRMNRKESAA